MPSEQGLVWRIEQLEKANRNLKRIGLLLFLVACGLMTMAQKSKKINYRAMDASAVTIRDDRGIARIKVTPKGIELFDAESKFAGAIRENASILNEVKAAQYSVFDTAGRDRILMSIRERPSIQVLNEEGKVKAAVGQEAIALFGNTKDEYNTITADRVSIRDATSATATVGVVETISPGSGLVNRTSAATITLFGRDGRVTWKAP